MDDFDRQVAELYRGVFEREPDPLGLHHHATALRQGTAISDLLQRFIGSPEFEAKHSRAQPSERINVVDYDPPLDIKIDLEGKDINRLWRHIGATWAQLGNEDPYWSVLSDPQFRMGNMNREASLKLFYDSGEAEIERLEAWLERNGCSLHADMVCAEYGCGVGRVTGWLARRCKQVRAFDISPTHQALAAAWLDKQDARNVEFHLVRYPEDLNQLSGTDLFFSSIVLQHNPPPIIRLILDKAFAHLKPGGIAFFQVPIYACGYTFDLERYLTKLNGRQEIEMHCLPQQHVFDLAARRNVVPLEIQQDGLTGSWGTSNTFLFRKLGK